MADLYRPPWMQGSGPIRRLVVVPTLRFMQVEAAGGIVLVVAAVIAMIWANAAHDLYEDFWHARITIDLAIWSFEESLQHVVNDVLMVVFFLVVGAEIKREVVHGELQHMRQAALPIAAALGGMIVPAADLRRVQREEARASRAGAFPSRPTSPLRSACWPWSVRACPCSSRSFCSRSRSPMMSAAS